MTRLALVTRERVPARIISETAITAPKDALQLAERKAVDAVALRLPVDEALALIPRLRRANPGLIVILALEDRRKEVRLRALQSGAHAIVPAVQDLESQVGLLETSLETLRLVAINQRLAQEALKTAQSLKDAVRESRELRQKRRRR
jgi:DNA-binding NarL/FixJ family response regulator